MGLRDMFGSPISSGKLCAATEEHVGEEKMTSGVSSPENMKLLLREKMHFTYDRRLRDKTQSSNRCHQRSAQLSMFCMR